MCGRRATPHEALAQFCSPTFLNVNGTCVCYMTINVGNDCLCKSRICCDFTFLLVQFKFLHRARTVFALWLGLTQNFLVSVEKTSCFGFKILFLSPQTQLKAGNGLEASLKISSGHPLPPSFASNSSTFPSTPCSPVSRI